MRIRNFALRGLAALAVLVVAGMTHAALQLYTSSNVRYLGHWTWNDDATNTATVEVLLKAQPPRRPPDRAAPQVCIQNFKVEVGALAEDGTFVRNHGVLQLRMFNPKEYVIKFDRQLTSLQFIKILSLPGGNCSL